MKTLLIFTKRNMMLFYKDKGVFLTSLITPLILLLLFVTFLGDVYKDSFALSIPKELLTDEVKKVIEGLAAGQLFSSLLAVCPITVAFCANMIMVNDKASNAIEDIYIAPVKKSIIAASYFLATFINTLIVCAVGMVISYIYIGVMGWYLSFIDILLILLDIFILTLLGTALSSIVNHFLSTQGQIAAVGSMVSSCYGFICGAYMPLSQFPEWLQKVLSFSPFTYGTSLLRGHTLRGAFAELSNLGISSEAIEEMSTQVDCNIEFFGKVVPEYGMYIYLIGFTVILLGIYLLINKFKNYKIK